MTADGHYTAAADVVAGSVSLGGALAGSVAYANITSGADVVADAASTADVGIAGATTITANGTHTATANSEVISFGFISLGVSVPTAITGGGTAAAFDGSVTGGGGLTVQATAVDNASVDSTPIAIGAFAGNGAAAYAEVTKDTQVTAAWRRSRPGRRLVDREGPDHGDQLRQCDAGLRGLRRPRREHHVRNGLRPRRKQRDLRRRLVSAGELKVQTDVSRSVETHMFVLAIAIAGAGAAASATAVIADVAESQERATIAGSANIHSAGTAITVKASRSANTFAEANGGAGGLLGSAAIMAATSNILGTVRASAGDAATIGTTSGKPGNLQLSAVDNSKAAATATVGSGALGFTAGGSLTNAKVAPTVEAFLGANVKVVLADGLGHDLLIQANSNNAEADATAKSYGGALGLRIGAPLANAKSQPVVNAYVGGGSTLVVGGKVTVDAQSNSNGSGDPLTDFINGLTIDGADTVFTDNSVSFTSHGLITGDVVRYHTNGGTLIGGLRDNHDYGVIVVDKDKLRFGATFNGAAVDADSVSPSAQGVDTNRAMVRFATTHHLENGDAIIYRTSGTSISSGFADGAVLFVRVIDAYTIELYSSQADATSGAFVFSLARCPATRSATAPWPTACAIRTRQVHRCSSTRSPSTSTPTAAAGSAVTTVARRRSSWASLRRRPARRRRTASRTGSASSTRWLTRRRRSRS